MEKLVIKLNFKRGLRSNKQQETPSEDTRPSKDPTGAKRQERFREKWKKDPVKRQKNINWCTEYRKAIKGQRKNDPNFDELMKKRERERKARYRKKQKEAKSAAGGGNNKGEGKDERTRSLKKTIKALHKVKRNLKQKIETLKSAQKTHTPTALRKRAQRVKKQLPQTPEKWADTIEHVVRNATPRKKQALDKVFTQKPRVQPKERNIRKRQHWRAKIRTFLERDDLSRQMPNKKDVVNVDGQPTAKRHLLSSKKETYLKFLEYHPLYPYKYTTFRKSFPRHIKKTNLNQRRVCVCLRCFNFSEKVRAISHESVLQKMGSMNLRSVYKDSVCDYEFWEKSAYRIA